MQHTQTHEKNKRKTEAETDEKPFYDDISQMELSEQTFKTEPYYNKYREYDISLNYTSGPGISSNMINSRTLPLPTFEEPSAPHYSSNYLIPSYSSHPGIHPMDQRISYNSVSVASSTHYPQNGTPHERNYYGPSNEMFISHESHPSHLVENEGSPGVAKRRMSVEDLYTPIEKLSEIKVESKVGSSSIDANRYTVGVSTIDMTVDEYEALQGLSKFKADSTESKTSDIHRMRVHNDSPNFSSQLCGLRQSIATSKVSHLRYQPMITTEIR